MNTDMYFEIEEVPYGTFFYFSYKINHMDLELNKVYYLKTDTKFFIEIIYPFKKYKDLSLIECLVLLIDYTYDVINPIAIQKRRILNIYPEIKLDKFKINRLLIREFFSSEEIKHDL